MHAHTFKWEGLTIFRPSLIFSKLSQGVGGGARPFVHVHEYLTPNGVWGHVPPGNICIKDLVIIHPQCLFDKVTELIVDTFTFEKVGMPEIKQTGIFSLSEFETVSSRSSTDIGPFQFAKLLEGLQIAAPFQMNHERMYFFPCVLAHTMETAVQQLTPAATPISQLIVTFECGYCPKGLAGALIKYQ